MYGSVVFIYTNPQHLSKYKSIEDNWAVFKDVYHGLVDKHVPRKMIRPGSRLKPPWTQYKSVDKATKDKCKAWVSYRKSDLEANRLLFEAEIKKKDQTHLEAKAHYEDKLVKDINSNPKRFWNYSRHFTKSSSTIDVLVDECGSKIHDDSEKADLLNRFFASTLTDEPDIVTSLPLPETQNTHLLLDIDISPLMIREKLAKLKANKAGGPDKISSNVLGECKIFDVPLALIYNQFIQSSCVPQDWRDADVNPLFKKGSFFYC